MHRRPGGGESWEVGKGRRERVRAGGSFFLEQSAGGLTVGAGRRENNGWLNPLTALDEM
jgi:hypothetical protein